jgi:hypothetical protein
VWRGHSCPRCVRRINYRRKKVSLPSRVCYLGRSNGSAARVSPSPLARAVLKASA